MSDHTLDASVRVDLNGNLQQNAKRNEQALGTLSRNGTRHLSVLQRTTATLDRSITRLGNRWVALATGGAMVAAGKEVVALQERFERLGIQANKSTEDMTALRKEIYEMSTQPDIRIDPSSLTSAIEEIIQLTGDMDFSTDNLENFAKALSATGAQGSSIGGIAAEFQKMAIIDPKGVMKAFDILNTQGKQGAFTLQNLAALGPRVVTAYTATGRTGLGAIREMGAVLQVIRRATGSSEEAATAYLAVLRVLNDENKAKVLKQGGIQIYDPEQLKKGKEIMRPLGDIMTDIVKKADGKASILSRVIGDSEAIKAFNSLVTEYNMTGNINSLKKFRDVQADGTNTSKDSARAARTAAGALRVLFAAGEHFADQELSEPIAKLAEELKNLKLDDIVDKLDMIKDGFMAIGAVIISYKVMKGAHELQKFGNSLRAGPKGNPMSGASMSSPIPVFVVNNISGAGLPGMGDVDGSKKNGKPPKVSKLSKLAGIAAISHAYLLAAGTGWVIGNDIIGPKAYKAAEGNAVGDWFGATKARFMATFGDEEAQRAVVNNGDAHPIYHRNYAGYDEYQAQQRITVELELSDEASKALKPKQTRKADNSDIDLEVSGSMGAR